MSLDPKDYLDISRDPRGYRDLKRELRRQPEEERFRFIWQIIPERRGLALRLANSCLRRRELFDRLLAEGIRTSDPSSIRTWLRWLVPRLGAVRVLRTVQRDIDAHPNVADSVLYAIPSFMLRCSRREAYAYEQLHTIARAKGYIRDPIIIPAPGGRIKFGSIE